MANPPLTEKQVYLALKEIFGALPIPPSTAKKIRKTIEKHKNEANIASLIQKYGVESITAVAQALLGDYVFSSKAKAQMRFPEVFVHLPGQASPPIIPEPKIATSSAEAVQRVGSYSPEELLGIGDRLKTRKEKEKNEAIAGHTQAQSFDCVSLPLWDQHRILVRVQYTLEKACFAFAQKRLSGMLQREGWDCAEAVELNHWARTLLIYRQDLNLDDVKDIAKPLPMLLESITQLRHTTVHRVRLFSSTLLEHLTDAGLLAQLLQDDGCSKTIAIIQQRTQDAIEKLVRNKQMLDCKLAEIKKEFAAKRAELERQEAALLEATVREHKEPVISVSGSLDRLSDGPGGSDGPHALWRRVSDDALPNEESSGSESIGQSTRGGEPEDGTPEAIDEDVEIANPPPVPVPTQPVDDGLVKPAMLREKEEADKDNDQALSMAEPLLSHAESKIDFHESDLKQSPEDLSVNQQEPETDTKNAAEEGEKKPETTTAFEADDPDLQAHEEEPLGEPSNSSTSTAVEDTEDDAPQRPHQSLIEDDTPIRMDTPIEDDPPVENEYMTLEEIIEELVATTPDPTPSPPTIRDKEIPGDMRSLIDSDVYKSIVKAVTQAVQMRIESNA